MAETPESNMPKAPELPEIQDIETPQVQTIDDVKSNMMNRLQDINAKVHDPFMNAKGENHNFAPHRDNGLNFERYYGRGATSKLGFNPYMDNEAIMNDNTSAMEDISAATQQWGNLFNLGFSTLWSGKTDREEAREYEQYSNIGSSTRGGVGGTVTNAYLNSGYTIGLLSEIAAEEVGLAALEAVTGGGATPIVMAKTAANANRLRRGLTGASKMSERIASMAGRIKDLKNIGQAKSFWNGAKNLGQAVNPLRGTTDFLATAGRQYKRGAGGKIEKLSEIAKLNKGFGTFYRDIREIRLAMDEANLESGFVSNKVKDDLVNEYIKDTGEHPDADKMDEINKQAARASSNAFATNSLLIYSTNRVAFGNIFNKYMPKVLKKGSQHVAGGRIVKNLKDKSMEYIKHGGLLGYKTFVNEARYAATNLSKMPLQTAKFLGKYSRANFGEGMQEYFQEVIQDAEYNMAKDRYLQGLSGGAWYNALANDNYMAAYNESVEKFISAEGAEVFASGFIMGGFAGPFAYMQQNAVKHLNKAGQYVYSKEKFKSDQAAEDKASEDVEDQISKFNDMTDSRKAFLYNYIEELRDQAHMKQEMDTALEEGRQKDFINLKDASLVQQLLFADSMGGYDLVLDKMKDMRNLSEAELREAFGDQVDEDSSFISDFQQSYDKVIARAEAVKEMMDNYDEMFPEGELYGATDSDFDTGIQEQDIKQARYYTKVLAIMNQQALVRNMDRMASILDNIYETAPFLNSNNEVPASEVTKIFNYDSLSKELSLLKQEISSLKEFDSKDQTQRADLKYKEEIYDILSKLTGKTGALNNYREGLANQYISSIIKKQQEEMGDLEVGKTLTYKRGNTSWEGIIQGEGTTKSGKEYWRVLKPGQDKPTTIYKGSDGIVKEEAPIIEDDFTEPLRDIYKQYLTAIGKKYNNNIDETTFDKSFQDFKDFYALGQDQKNLSETVSFMMNPEGHFAYVERYNALAKEKRENMGEEIRSQLESYQKGTEENDLIQMLAKEYNVYIDQDSLEALIKDDQSPTEFYNVDTDAPLKHDTQTYKDVKEAVHSWMVETNRAEEAPAAETTEEVKEEAAPVTEATTEEITLDTPLESYPAELVSRMEAEMEAYNKGIDERENLSDVAKKNAKINDLETFITSDATKARVRKILTAWNPKAQAPKAEPKVEPVPTTKEPETKVEDQVVEEASIDTELIDPKAKDTEEIISEVTLPLPSEIKNLLLEKRLRMLTLGATDPQTHQIVKELVKAKILKPNQGIDSVKVGTKISIPVTDETGVTKELVFVYTGLKNVTDAGGQHQMIIDLQLQTEKTGEYKYKVTIGEDTYYASSPNQQSWIEGDASKVLHTFNLREIRGIVEEVSGETDATWRKEIRDAFENSTDLESTYEELQAEDTKRDIEGKVSIGSEQLFVMYENAVEKFQGELTPGKLILGDEYKVKGKLRKFGTAKVSKKTKSSVTFVSTGKETLGQTETIQGQYLHEVIAKKLTDMEEDIAAEGLEEVTVADKQLLDQSSEEREELSGEEMDQAAEEFNSMSRADRMAKMKADRKKACK